MAPIAVSDISSLSLHAPSIKASAQLVIEPAAVLAQMSSEEKIAILSGDDQWHTVAIPRLGIPRVRMSDGPNGVRGTAWTNGAPASCFPAATGLGASFDVALAQRIGEALGAECRARGVHCLLGPTTNIQRHPCGGRGFESYSEDPFLAGTLACAWISGVQTYKVMTCPKHFLANEQEHLRRSNNSVIDERTMHEIYLEPFRLQCKTKPSVFMSSYNRVNGTHAAEHKLLLRDILRRDFGFGGLIVSDWSGTYSSSEAIKASLDLEMPGPAIMRGSSLERDIVGGKLTTEDLDDCVARLLHFVKEAQVSGIPFEAEEESIDTPAVRSLLREAANAGVVLLKNDTDLLPLSAALKSIAVIGPNANVACYAGGGSASLAPTYTVTPLDAITEAASEVGAEVRYALGADTCRWTPLLTPFIRPPGVDAAGAPGVQCDFYVEDPWKKPSTKPVFTKMNNSAFSYFIDGIPKHVPVRGFVSLKTSFIPNQSGTWELGLGVAGQADLYVDGKLIIDNSHDQTQDLLFFNTGAAERTGEIQVTAGTRYEIEVRFSNFKQINAMSPYSGRRGGIRIGGKLKQSASELIAEAVELAKNADVAVLVIGTNGEWESESYDRQDLKLPGHTDDLVHAVLAVKSETVIVNQSGMPVEMPWLAQASTVVQAFFGGNECGTAVADTLFGRSNPSGKLPITWPSVLEDYPSHGWFGQDLDTVYHEGLGVGYRHFDRPDGPRSAFPFGHGLSYTSFAFSALDVQPIGKTGATVTFTVRNSGKRAGKAVAQVYISPLAAPITRPEMELKGFAKVALSPAESQRVTVQLDHTAWSYYNVLEHCWVGEKGDYEVRVATSSTVVQMCAPFHLGESFRWIGVCEP